MKLIRFAGALLNAEYIASIVTIDWGEEYAIEIEMFNGSKWQEVFKSTLPGGYGAYTNAEMRLDELLRTFQK